MVHLYHDINVSCDYTYGGPEEKRNNNNIKQTNKTDGWTAEVDRPMTLQLLSLNNSFANLSVGHSVRFTRPTASSDQSDRACVRWYAYVAHTYDRHEPTNEQMTCDYWQNDELIHQTKRSK